MRAVEYGRVALVMAMAGSLLLPLGGCSNAKEGAVSGAAIGALSGLAIGSLTGGAGTGAAVGAVAGGVGGAVLGDQNRRKDEAAMASQTPPPAQSKAKGLARLAGHWKITGNIDGGDSKTYVVTGKATGTSDRSSEVQLDLQFSDPRSGQVVTGTSVIRQKGERTVTMTNAFSSSPEVKTFEGEMDETGTVLTFKQAAKGTAAPRRVVMRMTTYPGWTADVWDGDRRVESYSSVPSSSG